jgi:rhodanese-related sulfurtransferase
MHSTGEPADIEIDPERVQQLLDEPLGEGSAQAAQVIDVREHYERAAGHIAGTRHIEFAALTGAATSIDKEQPVVFYCRVGSRSDVAAKAFRSAGYDAYSMRGGLLRWVDEGLPLEPADGHVADH